MSNTQDIPSDPNASTQSGSGVGVHPFVLQSISVKCAVCGCNLVIHVERDVCIKCYRQFHEKTSR